MLPGVTSGAAQTPYPDPETVFSLSYSMEDRVTTPALGFY
jgi:hypothetical protein